MLNRLKQKYLNLSLPLRASLWFVICGALKDGIDFLTTPIFSRILDQEEYGLFTVYNSWFQIFRILITLYLFGDGFVVGLSKFNNKKEEFTSSQQGLATILVVPWILLYLVNWENWNNLLNMSTSLIVLMLAQSLFATPLFLWQKKKAYTYDIKKYVPVIVTFTLLQPITGIVLILLNRYGFSNGLIRIYSSVGIQILFGLTIYIIQFAKHPTFAKTEYWKYGIKANTVLLPHYLSQMLLNHSDKLMIDRFVGKSYAAVYSVAHSAAFTLLVVNNGINSAFTPWLHKKLKQKDVTEIRKLTSTMILLVAALSLVLVILAPELMMVLGDIKYTEGKWIIPPLTFGVFIMFLYTLFADIELFYNGNKYVTVSAIIGTTINIILNYLMIPIYGYLIAGYTTIIGFIAMCISHYLFFRKICKKQELESGDFFDFKLIVLTAIVLAGSVALIMYLYKFIWVRYIILFVIMILLFIKRKLLIDRITGMKKPSNSL